MAIQNTLQRGEVFFRIGVCDLEAQRTCYPVPNYSENGHLISSSLTPEIRERAGTPSFCPNCSEHRGGRIQQPDPGGHQGRDHRRPRPSPARTEASADRSTRDRLGSPERDARARVHTCRQPARAERCRLQPEPEPRRGNLCCRPGWWKNSKARVFGSMLPVVQNYIR